MKIKKLSDDRLTFSCAGCGCLHYADERWAYNGDHEKPTFTPSILVNYGEGKVCHSFVTDGRIQYLGDSYHELGGQTIDLPEWGEFK